MARILDANEKFVGKEPKFTGEINDSEIGSALSWYSQNKTSKDPPKSPATLIFIHSVSSVDFKIIGNEH